MPPGNPGLCKQDDGEKAIELGLIGGRMKIFYYIGRFWEISGIEKRLLLVGLLITCWVKICMTFLPYRWYLNLNTIKSKNVNKSLDLNHKKIIAARKTVKRLSNILPWKINCVGKVIILKTLLQIMGIIGTIKLSVKIKDKSFAGAHAYLSLNHDNHIYKQPGYSDIFY